MQPRPHGRGNMMGVQVERVAHEASMQPRPHGRGNMVGGWGSGKSYVGFNAAAASRPRKYLIGRQARTRATRLQCSRGLTAAEI